MLLKNCKILKNGKFKKVDILIKDDKIEKISNINFSPLFLEVFNLLNILLKVNVSCHSL